MVVDIQDFRILSLLQVLTPAASTDLYDAISLHVGSRSKVNTASVSTVVARQVDIEIRMFQSNLGDRVTSFF